MAAIIRKWAGRIVTVLGALTAVVGFQIGIWAPVLGDHHRADLASALMFTGWLIGAIGYLVIHDIDEPW